MSELDVAIALGRVSKQLDADLTRIRGNGGSLGTHARGDGLVCLADVEPKAVRWLWQKRIVLGKVNVLDGDPGLGKSLLALSIAARVTRGGSLPDGMTGDLEGPAGVLLLSAEDDLEDTIRPRLDAAGADVSRVFVLMHTGLDDEAPTIPESIPTIEGAIEAVGAKLVIIDPIMAFLSADVEAHKDQHVRRALAPLARMAERLGVAVLVIRHLNKGNSTNPLYRGGGSIGIIGAARSGLLVARDPDDPSGKRRILASTKSNLAEQPESLAYFIEQAENAAARIVWEGGSAHTASTLLVQPADDEESESLGEAKGFLSDVLKGGPVEATEVKKQARLAGISERTLWRAKAGLGVMAEKRAHDGRWQWRMCANRANRANRANQNNTANVGIHDNNPANCALCGAELVGDWQFGADGRPLCVHCEDQPSRAAAPVSEEPDREVFEL